MLDYCRKLFFFLFLTVVCATPALAADKSGDVRIPKVAGEGYVSSLVVLETMQKYMTELQSQLKRKRKELDSAESADVRNKILKEINELTDSLQELEKDFLHMAAGVDLKSLESREESDFKWNQEVVSLIRPLVQELKKMTARPRKLERLRSEAEEIRDKLPVVRRGIGNLSTLVRRTDNPGLKERLASLRKEWENRKNRLQNSLAVIQTQLKKLEQEKQSFVQTARQNLESFFRNRGKNALLAVLSFVLAFLGLRFLWRRVQSILAGRKKDGEKKTFYARLGELLFHIFTAVAAIGALLTVLFATGDWVLLSLVIIFLLGLGWTAKQGLMRFWEQIKLFLNLGSVREGERLVYAGVPWKVNKLNFYTSLENPAFDKCRLRIPIRDLVDKESRPFAGHEPWFPTKRGDWVLFQDGSRGKVVSQTHEMVQIVRRGGSRQTFQTSDFLSRAPVNLSVNFRLRVVFGIDYAHQEECTHSIPEKLHEFVEEGLREEGYADDLLNLRVEFHSAGASSLNLIVLADFHGRRAELYNRLTRSLQRLAVEACNKYEWGIPFTQITIHQAYE